MKLGGRHLANYGATRSRHDFTQRQLMACLILRAYLKTTYRGVLEFLSVSPCLREELGLADKLPHYTTLQKFSARSKVLEIADAMIRTIGQAAGLSTFGQGAAAMDATGLETTTASAHFQCRRGGERRKWVKISTIVLCGSLLPLGLVLDWGPNNDKCQARALIAKASQASLPAKLYADAVGQSQSPEDIVTAIINSVNDKGNFFHGTAAGRNVRISNPSADSNCDTVTVEAR